MIPRYSSVQWQEKNEKIVQTLYNYVISNFSLTSVRRILTNTTFQNKCYLYGLLMISGGIEDNYLA